MSYFKNKFKQTNLFNYKHRIKLNNLSSKIKEEKLKIKEERLKIKEDKERLFRNYDKCETEIQWKVYIEVSKKFLDSNIQIEKWIHDYKYIERHPEYKRRSKPWRLDILFKNEKICLELDGNQHRFNDIRFKEDEEKDTFLTENGFWVFRRSNDWFKNNYKRVPEILENFLKKRKEINL